jgi:ABC-type antimicrobial peptide transport system permease subunit
LLGAFFTVAALFLAAMGNFAAICYSVVLRILKLGIQIALGAQRLEGLRRVCRNNLVVVTGGAALGLAMGVLLSRLMPGACRWMR